MKLALAIRQIVCMNGAVANKKRAAGPPTLAEKLAYSIPEFAELVSISENQLRRHIKGELDPVLVVSYSGLKGVVRREEGERWLALLPNEPTSK